MQNVLRGLLILVMWLLAGPQYGLAAQPYPQRPIRMIVGLPVGGSTDLLGRLLAAKLGERLGQQVVFENRPGASGRVVRRPEQSLSAVALRYGQRLCARCAICKLAVCVGGAPCIAGENGGGID